MIHVLIVEDDPMVASINRSFILKVPEYTVVGIVSSGTEAIQFLKGRTRKVDLILLDVFMPQMDGLSFLEKIKQLCPSIDVIMVTAAKSSESVRFALSHGVVDYIIKPFTYERMAQTLNSYKIRFNILNKNQLIEQNILDKQLFNRNTEENSEELPKGVDKHTLILVQDAIRTQNKAFSTKDLSDIMGISRISLRKYLVYLEKKGIIEGTLIYKAKGRPVQMYEYKKINH